MRCSRILLCGLAVLLSACDESRFDVDPLGEARQCESSLAGVWRIVDDNDGAPEYLQVAGNCDVRLLRAPRSGEGGVGSEGEPRQPVELAPSVGRIERTLYVTLTDEDWHRAGEDEDEVPHGGFSGYHVLKVESSGERLRLRAVDHVALAKAIIDDKVNGEVNKTEDGLKNRVSADLDTTRALLRERWLFRGDDPLVLERVAPDALSPALRRQAGIAP